MSTAEIHWAYLERYDQHWLMLGSNYLALVSRCYNDEWPWLVHVNRHRGLEGKITSGYAKTVAHAKKMAERWAEANLPRIRREIETRSK